MNVNTGSSSSLLGTDGVGLFSGLIFVLRQLIQGDKILHVLQEVQQQTQTSTSW